MVKRKHASEIVNSEKNDQSNDIALDLTDQDNHNIDSEFESSKVRENPKIDEELVTSEELFFNVENQSIENDYSVSSTKKSRSDIRKPTTAWLLYATENRGKLQKKNLDLGFTEIAKLLGEDYRNLSTEEKCTLDEQVKQDKLRYLKELQNTLPVSTIENFTKDLIIPVGRVKKIIKLDHDVKSIGKEATSALTKATEIFLNYLLEKSLDAASIRGSKCIRDNDIVHAVHINSNLEFLRLDFAKATILQVNREGTKFRRNSNIVTGNKSVKNFFDLKKHAESVDISENNEET